jgi:hypothetical protein
MADEGGQVSITEDTGLVAGVDTHRDTHTAALCDCRGQVLAQLQVTADPDGYAGSPGPGRQQKAPGCGGRSRAPAITG